MNMERAAMRGKLAEAELRQAKLNARIESAAQAIRQGLNTTLFAVADLEIPQLDEQWDLLKASWAEYFSLDGEIRRLKRELE